MDRVANWGIVLDETNTNSVTATYRGASVTVQKDDVELARLTAALQALNIGAFQRPDPPSLLEQRRFNYLYYLYKLASYLKRINEITAQIQAYPRPRDVPQELRDERQRLIAKYDRFPNLRDKASAELGQD